MNKKSILIFVICIIISLPACSIDSTKSNGEISITDDMGNTVFLSENPDAVSCYGSFAECWLLAGGSLIGVTEDALIEHAIDHTQSTAIVGTVKEINIETLSSLNPDYVILSADLTAHLSLQPMLDSLNINYGYFSVDTFEDYKSLMKRFCNVTKRDDLFQENVIDVETRIEKIRAKIPKASDKKVLLIRAFSSGIKAKRDDNLAGQILKEFGVANIADTHPSLLEEMSVEHIIKENPDYIFALTMGSEAAAITYLKENIENNKVWQDLKAVKNNNYILLPKNLFHYKPNNRWDESYEYLAKIIYPEAF